ncbi:MAG: D-2-hydroxyacid dehydrogenase [Oscillospiraceae bacterium]
MKIVILDAYAANPGDLSWDEFAALGELTVYDRTAQEDAAARIGDAEVVFINKVRLTDEIFAACPNLKLVSILATGYNIVDLAAAKRRGITVCNVPGYSTRAVVQMTFALLLEICQQVGLHSGAVHTGRWQTCPDFCFWDRPLIELDGKTMGIVGYGAIGSAVGTVAQALGMKLLVTARHEKPVPEGARFVSLPELLAQSDVVSLHCPQTAENARMIDAGALAQMKDGAILLNTARGGLLDEQAVADALRSGKLLAAGMDVVSAEPIRADNPLLTAPNCFLTPHIAWAPLETRRRLQAISAENLRAFLAGKPQNVVNP